MRPSRVMATTLLSSLVVGNASAEISKDSPRPAETVQQRTSSNQVPVSPTAARTTRLPLSLQQALQRLDRLDPTLRAKMLERMRATLAERRARWQRFQVHVGTRVGYMLGTTNLANTDGGAALSYDRAGLGAVASIRVPLYDGGAIRADIAAARYGQEAARLQVELTRQQAHQQVLVAYAALVAAHQKTNAVTRSLERVQGLLQLTLARLDSGLGQKADVARARLNVLGRKEQLLAARQLEATAEAALKSALLLPTAIQIEVTNNLEDVTAWSLPGTKAVPELKLADTEVRQAEEQRARARAGYMPKVDLLASGTYGNLSGLPWTGEGALAPGAVPSDDRLVGNLYGSAAAGIVLSWSAFDSFATRDALEDADYRVAVSKQRRRATKLELRQRRDDAITRERYARLRQQSLKQAVRQARTAIELAKTRYETGNGLLSEVLDAELDAISIELRKIQAYYDAAVAHVDRMRSEGTQL